MPEDRFDPSGYLTFDLARGSASLPDAASAVVLPADVLERVAGGKDGIGPALVARPLGEWLGARLRERLAAGGGNPADASPESFLAQANGLLAVHGLGRISLEAYGDAVLLRTELVVLPKAGAGFLEPFCSGLFGAFLGREVPCLALDGPGGACVLIGSPPAVRRAAQLKAAGVPAETIATRLHQESRAAREGKR
ncbi:MAG: hypothetical protein HY907_07285 [Deltaproteobacteria bacterium]|nr:hypothetical protein [Deltaproteobacteria bacterium]